MFQLFFCSPVTFLNKSRINNSHCVGYNLKKKNIKVKGNDLFFFFNNYEKKKLVKSNSHFLSFLKMNSSNLENIDSKGEQDLSGDGGVIKKTIKEGSGNFIQDGAEVKLNYLGKLSDGRVFDSSFARKKPFSFVLGEGKVISGWEVGIKAMKVGEKSEFFISSQYGYKKKGIPPIIPPNADLFFEIEIIDAETPEKIMVGENSNFKKNEVFGLNNKIDTSKNSEKSLSSNKFFFISPFSSQSGEKAPWWLNPNITFFLIFIFIIFLFISVYSLGGINHSFDNPSSILDSEN